jgi:hypothetical protein
MIVLGDARSYTLPYDILLFKNQKKIHNCINCIKAMDQEMETDI